jgi:hypothetical protein
LLKRINNNKLYPFVNTQQKIRGRGFFAGYFLFQND